MINYNKLIDAICELVNLAWDSTSKEEFERLDNAGADIIDCLEKLQQFEAIGTIEELQELKEKSRAKKIRYEHYCGFRDAECPVCGKGIHNKDEYCSRCGQKFDRQ